MRGLLLVFGLMCATVSAQTIYTLKGEDEGILLTSQEHNEQKYSKYKVEKKTYQPNNMLEWNYNCQKDKFNGIKSCTLNKSYSDIMVSIVDGRHGVYVGRNHYPRTHGALKIDENTPFYGQEGSINSPLKVIEQLKKGKTAYTRYQEWPYKHNKDSEVSLDGFSEKYDEMLEEYKKL